VAPEVVVHWRPGCPFCAALLLGLRLRRVPHRRIDIWQDPEGAAWVRSVAGGHETVPTVRIGDVALVNPSTGAVVAALAAADRD
jgi:mycoredoxin